MTSTLLFACEMPLSIRIVGKILPQIRRPVSIFHYFVVRKLKRMGSELCGEYLFTLLLIHVGTPNERIFMSHLRVFLYLLKKKEFFSVPWHIRLFLPLFLQLSDLHHCSCMYTLRVSYRSSRRHGMPNFHFLYPCNKLVTALLWRLTFGKKFFFIYFLSKLYSTYRH